MPTERHGKVRRLLKEGKAKVLRRCPFTAQLLYETGNAVQEITLGVDAGSKHIGLSATTETKELYAGEYKLRTDITKNLATRREFKRVRRNRKTRYRKPRFNNRVKSKHKGWLAPSIEAKIGSHLKIIEDIHNVGIKEFYTDSNGNIVANPRTYRKHEKKLVREQRRLSRKQNGSNNRNKQRIRLAIQHEKIANIRRDFLHKQTHALANENQVVCVEDLNVKGMLRNHRLAKAISDVSWSEFFRQLEYKMSERGGIVVKVPTFYPSSQTCSCCGYKNPLVKNLSVRDWDCPKCGAHHDRDYNAATNILSKGLEMLA